MTKTAPEFTEAAPRKKVKCAPCKGAGCEPCKGKGWAFAPFYGPGDGTSQAAISTAAPASPSPSPAPSVMASREFTGQSIVAEVEFLSNLGRPKA